MFEALSAHAKSLQNSLNLPIHPISNHPILPFLIFSKNVFFAIYWTMFADILCKKLCYCLHESCQIAMVMMWLESMIKTAIPLILRSYSNWLAGLSFLFFRKNVVLLTFL